MLQTFELIFQAREVEFKGKSSEEKLLSSSGSKNLVQPPTQTLFDHFPKYQEFLYHKNLVQPRHDICQNFYTSGFCQI